eukprot:gene25054-50143_t
MADAAAAFHPPPRRDPGGAGGGTLRLAGEPPPLYILHPVTKLSHRGVAQERVIAVCDRYVRLYDRKGRLRRMLRLAALDAHAVLRSRRDVCEPSLLLRLRARAADAPRCADRRAAGDLLLPLRCVVTARSRLLSRTEEPDAVELEIAELATGADPLHDAALGPWGRKGLEGYVAAAEKLRLWP